MWASHEWRYLVLVITKFPNLFSLYGMFTIQLTKTPHVKPMSLVHYKHSLALNSSWGRSGSLEKIRSWIHNCLLHKYNKNEAVWRAWRRTSLFTVRLHTGKAGEGQRSLVDGSGVPPKTEELHRACRSARLLEGGWDVRSLQLGSSVPVMGITGS